jgi:hypothetical protein
MIYRIHALTQFNCSYPLVKYLEILIGGFYEIRSFGRLLTVLLAASSASQAATLLSEDFDNVAALSGQGWVLTNESSPIGEFHPSGWFQGNDGIFPAQDGAPGAYAASNFYTASLAGGATLANRLITPVFSTAAA